MARFLYEAKISPTETTKGVLVADSRNAAIQKISQMGYYLVSIEEEGGAIGPSAGSGFSFFNRVGLKQTTDFTRQLSDLLESGLSIVKALDILCNQTESKRLKRVILDIKDFCISGNPLSAALARHPDVFSDLYVSMVRSGETGGALENILKRLSDFSEKQLEIRTKIRTALAYPILMSVIGCVTIVILMTFVIPKMTAMFSDLGQVLPLPTRILLGISGFLTNYWWILIAIIAIIAVTAAKIYATADGRLAIDRLKLGSPVAGPLIKKVELARFARTLATLLNNGVPILEALKIVSETMENALIRGEFAKTYASVREGSSLARGLSGSAVIPPVVINMVAVGEEGGHLERSLLKVAETYERESDEAIKIMMSLLEPFLILTLGVVVGFIVISMLLPIFEINFLMR
ncbi:MAG: type II secretion system F family protein [Candidatus Omnitrophota bacterium]